ncbi:MAG: fimbrillin family protein [Bacteroidales bacterium]|nr:fimbrillin family protein [Bacteroidales bacterium]
MKRNQTLYHLGLLSLFLLALSCIKDEGFEHEDGEILFGVRNLMTVETKASEVTSSTLGNDGFYVSAVTEVSGVQSSAFESTHFQKESGSSSFFGDRYWPASDLGYKFYASNQELTFASGLTSVTVVDEDGVLGSDTDVVCAYLSNPSYKQANVINFQHILARVSTVVVQAETGSDVSDITITIKNLKTGGTFTLYPPAWSNTSPADGSHTIYAYAGSIVSDNTHSGGNIALWLLPGNYTFHATWKAKATGEGDSWKNLDQDSVSPVELHAGQVSALKFFLSGDAMRVYGVLDKDYIGWANDVYAEIGNWSGDGNADALGWDPDTSTEGPGWSEDGHQNDPVGWSADTPAEGGNWLSDGNTDPFAWNPDVPAEGPAWSEDGHQNDPVGWGTQTPPEDGDWSADGGTDPVGWDPDAPTEGPNWSNDGLPDSIVWDPKGFSVSADKQVVFAPGNLQAVIASGSSADYTVSRWQFAAHQYDYVGSASFAQNSVIDLFEFGTEPDEIYQYATDWRILSAAEWVYLFNWRAGASVNGQNGARYIKAQVQSVNGLLLFPDDAVLTIPEAYLLSVNATNADWSSFSAEQWTALEAAGCIFLPAAGWRQEASAHDANLGGYYGTSSTSNAALKFDVGNLATNDSASSAYAKSLRLVRDL